MKYLYLLFCLFTGISYSQSQLIKEIDQGLSISPEASQEDLRILKQNLEHIHPGLYTYTSKEELDAYFEKVEDQLNEAKTEIEFYQLIGPLLALIGDAHTDIEITDESYAPVEETFSLFPFGVKWVEGALFVIKNLSSIEAIQPGDEILSINSQSAGSVFKQLSRYWARDGYNTSSPYRQLANAFMDYYALVIATPDYFNLEIRKKNGQLVQHKLPGLTWPELLAFYQERYPEEYALIFSNKKYKPKPFLDLTIENGVGVLKIKSFHPGKIRSRGQRLERFLKKSFERIEKEGVNQLVLDIRNNKGGSGEAVVQLLQYLLDQPFQLYTELSTNTRTIPNHAYFSEDVAELEAWAKGNLIEYEGRFLLPADQTTQEVLPKDRNYKGQLYVLVNGGTHSAAGDCSGIIKQFKRGVFIGEESGGNPCQNTAGNSLTLNLPNSKIKVTIPTILFKINTDVENTGRGILPDYLVKPSIQDLIADKDVVLEFALELIKKPKLRY